MIALVWYKRDTLMLLKDGYRQFSTRIQRVPQPGALRSAYVGGRVTVQSAGSWAGRVELNHCVSHILPTLPAALCPLQVPSTEVVR
jgi:hypothetical protein